MDTYLIRYIFCPICIDEKIIVWILDGESTSNQSIKSSTSLINWWIEWFKKQFLQMNNKWKESNERQTERFYVKSQNAEIVDYSNLN